MSNSIVTLSTVVNLARTHIDLLPLTDVGGYSNEPALSLANDTMSELLTTPNDWKWNRNEMPMLVTSMNKQDYLFAGASAFTLGATASGAAIDLATNNGCSEATDQVTVTTLENHRFKVGDVVYLTGVVVAAFNSTFTDDGTTSTWTNGWTITSLPAANKFVFTHSQQGLGNSGAPGVNNYGWLCRAAMVEMNNTSSPQNVRQLETVKELPLWSRVGDPEKVCVISDQGNGVMKIRAYYVPGSTIWGLKLIYQGKPPIKTALSDTWAPIPDHYAALVRQAFLYRCYRYLNSSRAEVEYQKLQQEVMRAQGADDNEQSDVNIVPSESLMDNSGYFQGW